MARRDSPGVEVEDMISPVKIWRHQKKINTVLGQEGKIVSFTVVRVAPLEFKQQAPYPVVIVRTKEGKKLVGQLVDWEKKHLKIGQKVKAVYRKIKEPTPEGVIPYGIKFKPIKKDG